MNRLASLLTPVRSPIVGFCPVVARCLRYFSKSSGLLQYLAGNLAPPPLLFEGDNPLLQVGDFQKFPGLKPRDTQQVNFLCIFDLKPRVEDIIYHSSTNFLHALRGFNRYSPRLWLFIRGHLYITAYRSRPGPRGVSPTPQTLC